MSSHTLQTTVNLERFESYSGDTTHPEGVLYPLSQHRSSEDDTALAIAQIRCQESLLPEGGRSVGRDLAVTLTITSDHTETSPKQAATETDTTAEIRADYDGTRNGVAAFTLRQRDQENLRERCGHLSLELGTDDETDPLFFDPSKGQRVAIRDPHASYDATLALTVADD